MSKKPQTLVKELVALKAERDQLDKQIKTIQDSIIDTMGDEPLTVEEGDRVIRVTKVQGFRSVWDEAALRSMLGQSGWLKVSSRVLDKKKLESKIAGGEVDPEVVVECVTEMPNAPYLRFT